MENDSVKAYEAAIPKLPPGLGRNLVYGSRGESYMDFDEFLKRLDEPINEDDYEYVPCTCPCHHDGKMMHFMPCCENGLVKVRKGTK